MKKLIPLVQYCVTAALCLGTVSARSDFVSPRVPPVPGRPQTKMRPPWHKPPFSGLVVTTVNDGGPGSLRQAIANANPGDTIRFALKLPATIALSNTLVISQSLSVLGPGPDQLTIMRSADANTPPFRVLDIETGTVTVAGVTISNGVAFDTTTFVDNVGGGLFNRGNLTLNNCVISGNSAPTTGPAASQSLGFGGGIFTAGGSQLTIINSTISGNQADAAGGGICTLEATAFLALGSTISGNSAVIQGGGINYQGHTGTIQNCTIAGNAMPPDGAGSALCDIVLQAEPPTLLTLTACTVAYNTGATNGAIAVVGLNQGLGITNRLLSTLVADNTMPNFAFFGTYTLQTLGHNLDSDGSSGLVNGANGDIVGTAGSPINAQLGPLQDNGGPTDTIALVPGSPALGAGSCTDANGAPLLTDQRGFPRLPSQGCDIGAYQNEPLLLRCPPSIVTEAQTAAGAMVNYNAIIHDFCPEVSVTYQPPSGSLFPIGTTTVTVSAIDGCSSNTEQCSFTVTVLGAEGVKSNVLASLQALRAGATNHRDQQFLDEAIADLVDSLDPALWVDQNHVDPTNGVQVFGFEQDAAGQLVDILKNRQSRIPDEAVLELIKKLVKADRLLAVVSIQDAKTAGANPNRIKQAQQQLAVGDQQAARGNPEQAIQHYALAWSRVQSQ